jgi:hypothetical protein
MAPKLRRKVPTIQGKIPPLVMESKGAWVRKVQLMALHPLDRRKKMTISKANPLMSAAPRNRWNIPF